MISSGASGGKATALKLELEEEPTAFNRDFSPEAETAEKIEAAGSVSDLIGRISDSQSATKAVPQIDAGAERQSLEDWLGGFCPGQPIGFVKGQLAAVLFSGDEGKKKLEGTKYTGFARYDEAAMLVIGTWLGL